MSGDKNEFYELLLGIYEDRIDALIHATLSPVQIFLEPNHQTNIQGIQHPNQNYQYKIFLLLDIMLIHQFFD